MHISNDIPKGFVDNTFVAIDTEFTGQQTNKLHRPHGKFAIMTMCAVPDFVNYTTDPQEISLALKHLDNCVWVMQNAKYDITQLRPYAPIPPRTRLIDTMLIERILWNGYYDSFSLDAMVRRYLDEESPNEDEWHEQLSKKDKLTDDDIEHACQHASKTARVWLAQKELLTKTDMKIWRKIDQPALWAVLDFQGFRIDPEAWAKVAEKNKEKVEEIDEDLPINPRSPGQVLELLRNLGFQNLHSTGEKELRKAIRKYPKATEAIELTNKVLESRKYGTQKSRYGINFLDVMMEEVDGIPEVIADYQITGAKTGRMSAAGGMHNIPIRETKVFRECFLAKPGNKLVIADYDAQEARVTAFLTQDQKLIEIFHSGKKVYIEAGREIFGKPDIKKGDPEYSKMKSTFLGMDYGMTEYGLMNRENITKAEAIDLIERFFAVFPGVYQWVTKQRELKKNTYTVSGRRAWLNPYSGQCERNALNNPHQGTAADITKKALGYIHKNWQSGGTSMYDIPFGVVGVYHDEIVLDVPEEHAEWVKKYTEYWMVKAAEEICVGIPFKVDASVCDSWSEK